MKDICRILYITLEGERQSLSEKVNVPKMNSEGHGTRARKDEKLYHKLLNDCRLILDDEKYSQLSEDNFNDNGFLCSTHQAPVRPKFVSQKKARLKQKR